MVQIADEQLVNAISEAHDVGGYTYRRMADFIVEATGHPAVTNERRRKLGNVLKERRGRAQRATKRCADRVVDARTPLHDDHREQQDDDMTHDPFLRKRRIIEETFGPPPGDDQLDGVDDDFDDDDDQDHDLGDAGDGNQRGPGPR